MFSGLWKSQDSTPASPPPGDSPAFSQYGSFGPRPGPTLADETIPEESETYGANEARRFNVAKLHELKTWRDAWNETRIHLPDFLLPWAMFSLLLLVLAFFISPLLPILTLILCMTLCGAFVALSKGKPWLILAAICLCSVALAICMARYTQSTYLNEYNRVYNQRWYSNVMADESPVAKKDASLLEFSAESFVDTSRSVGYKMGSLYCAAPVVTSLGQETAGYWAVGRDCCQERSYFACGPILDNTVKSSVVVLNVSSANEELAQKYTVAAQMAARTYGMGLLDTPTFVYWKADPMGYRQDLLEGAINFGATAILAFACVALSAALIFPLVGVALAGQRSDLPYQADAQLMLFGWYFDRHDDRGGRYDPEVQRQVEQDLFEKRACWSGEVIHDYIFFVCNNSLFIGPLGCHPEHPFSHFERFLTLLAIAPLIVFPVSAITLTMPDDGLLRVLVIAVAATMPRNILKHYLLLITVEDSEAILIEGARSHGHRATRARRKEVLVFLMVYILVALVCCLCVLYIKSRGNGEPITEILASNCDGLCFAFVLELIFELLIPKVVNEGLYGKKWVIGFFGRWIYENQQMAAQRGVDQKSLLQRYETQALQKARNMAARIRALDNRQENMQSPQFGTHVGYLQDPKSQPGAFVPSGSLLGGTLVTAN